MKYIKYLFFVLIAVLSCNAQKKYGSEYMKIDDSNLDKGSFVQVIDQSIPTFKDTYAHANETEEQKNMKIFLYENDKSINESNYEIVFIEKANFGIFEGDNWIVLLDNSPDRYTSRVFIYVIDKISINKKIQISSTDDEFDIIPLIMRNIPGKRIGNTNISFGDFNNDGIDEILTLDFGLFNLLEISVYNKESKIIENIFTIPFQIKDFYQDTSPIKYLHFNDMYGFNILYVNYREAEDANWTSDLDIGKWIFFAWDVEKETYVRYGEIDS